MLILRCVNWFTTCTHMVDAIINKLFMQNFVKWGKRDSVTLKRKNKLINHELLNRLVFLFFCNRINYLDIFLELITDNFIFQSRRWVLISIYMKTLDLIILIVINPRLFIRGSGGCPHFHQLVNSSSV